MPLHSYYHGAAQLLEMVFAFRTSLHSQGPCGLLKSVNTDWLASHRRRLMFVDATGPTSEYVQDLGVTWLFEQIPGSKEKKKEPSPRTKVSEHLGNISLIFGHSCAESTCGKLRRLILANTSCHFSPLESTLWKNISRFPTSANSISMYKFLYPYGYARYPNHANRQREAQSESPNSFDGPLSSIR